MEVRDFADWPKIAAVAVGQGEHRALDARLVASTAPTTRRPEDNLKISFCERLLGLRLRCARGHPAEAPLVGRRDGEQPSSSKRPPDQHHADR